MSGIQKRQDSSVRIFKKPSTTLYNKEVVDKYIQSYGIPTCLCCYERTERALFHVKWKIPLCINCWLTILCVGTCFHDLEIKSNTETAGERSEHFTRRHDFRAEISRYRQRYERQRRKREIQP